MAARYGLQMTAKDFLTDRLQPADFDWIRQEAYQAERDRSERHAATLSRMAAERIHDMRQAAMTEAAKRASAATSRAASFPNPPCRGRVRPTSGWRSAAACKPSNWHSSQPGGETWQNVR